MGVVLAEPKQKDFSFFECAKFSVKRFGVGNLLLI